MKFIIKTHKLRGFIESLIYSLETFLLNSPDVTYDKFYIRLTAVRDNFEKELFSARFVMNKKQDINFIIN